MHKINNAFKLRMKLALLLLLLLGHDLVNAETAGFFGYNVNISNATSPSTAYCGYTAPVTVPASTTPNTYCAGTLSSTFGSNGGSQTLNIGDSLTVYLRYIYNGSLANSINSNTTLSASFFPLVDQYAILSVPSSIPLFTQISHFLLFIKVIMLLDKERMMHLGHLRYTLK